MGKMYLMCGLSGVGKTTFAKKFAEDNNCIYLAIDDFYKKWVEENCPGMDSPWEDEDVSFKVWIEFFQTIHRLYLRRPDKDMMIDTNAPTRTKRFQFIDWFPCFDSYNLIFVMANENLRIENNKSRDRVVPDDVMVRMWEEFESPGVLSGSSEKGFSEFFVTEHQWDSIRVLWNENNEWYRDLVVRDDDFLC